MEGKILWDGSCNLSKLQPLKAALHLIVARHTNPPLLPESFRLVWQKHADGHITVTYVKELQLEMPDWVFYATECGVICETRTVFTTAMNYYERKVLCD